MDKEDDDLYSGYNDDDGMYDPMGADAATGTENPFGDAGPRAAPTAGMRTAMGTAAQGDETLARPMTSVKAAGYSSQPMKPGQARGFDPLGQGSKGPAPPLQKKSEATMEEHCKDLERQVNDLLEESCKLSLDGDAPGALDKAKEAGKRERALCKQREQSQLADQINIDLTYAVCFNLAHQYHVNKLYTEALNTYSSIVKNKQFSQSGRLRVNMGNIYFEQKKMPNAIKMYRMALDQIPNTAREIRFKIMRNIGNAFVRMGQYQDAMQSYDTVMENAPDMPTGFNLVVCFYALGDKEKMKKSFVRLLTIMAPETENDEEASVEMAADDGLREELRKRLNEAQKLITTAAKLVAPVVDKNGFVAGFEWVVEQLNAQGYVAIANEMEMAKAIMHLNRKDFEKALNVLKGFERKEQHLKARAATNLSFLYFLEGDVAEAEKNAELAVQNDRYNARALVNRGNCLYEKNDYEGAKMAFLEAVGVEADCVEAIYNLGLVNKRLGNLEDCLVAFKKLNTILPDNVEVIYQIGNVYDLLGNYKQAIKWFEILNSRVMHDPGVLARLGAIHSKYEDEAKALHYYSESHRVYPVNMDVISWLGAFHVKSDLYEKAMPFFDLASKIQPMEVKWQLMVASCYRRIGAYPLALNKYKEIHRSHPENVECLRYLVHICTDLGRKEEVHDYVVKLRKAERSQSQEQAARQAMTQNAQNLSIRTNMEDEAAGAGGGGTPASSPRGNQRSSPFRAPERPQGRALPTGDGAPKNDDEWGNGMLGDDLLPGM
mmetsp:Transcript_18157/g.21753  ORF Transcript_18157/g.21753 Transcript_18157/m.21753 type:complete len:774 (-) Transcript_18157:386-2707(-)